MTTQYPENHILPDIKADRSSRALTKDDLLPGKLSLQFAIQFKTISSVGFFMST